MPLDIRTYGYNFAMKAIGIFERLPPSNVSKRKRLGVQDIEKIVIVLFFLDGCWYGVVYLCTLATSTLYPFVSVAQSLLLA